MKVKEIVKICGELADLDFPSTYFVLVNTPDDSRARKLVECCNTVLEELYRSYAQALRKTVVEVKDGFCDTSAYKMCRVLSLVDGEGQDVHFRYGDNKLWVERDGLFNMCYARLPDEVSWDSEVVLPSQRITDRVFVYGVLREYYAVTGDWDLARQWDDRFRDALAVCCSTQYALRLPVRGWW